LFDLKIQSGVTVDLSRILPGWFGINKALCETHLPVERVNCSTWNMSSRDNEAMQKGLRRRNERMCPRRLEPFRNGFGVL
jgi:hypothetical protein